MSIQKKVIGNFLNDDKIEEIANINIKEIKIVNKKEILLLIKWQSRKNNIKPENSWVSSEVVKYHAPKELIKYYESNILGN